MDSGLPSGPRAIRPFNHWLSPRREFATIGTSPSPSVPHPLVGIIIHRWGVSLLCASVKDWFCWLLVLGTNGRAGCSPLAGRRLGGLKQTQPTAAAETLQSINELLLGSRRLDWFPELGIAAAPPSPKHAVLRGQLVFSLLG